MTFTGTTWYPSAPSGRGGFGPAGWTAPVPSIARTIRVACPGTGVVQPPGPKPPLPDGAEGYHVVPVKVV